MTIGLVTQSAARAWLARPARVFRDCPDTIARARRGPAAGSAAALRRFEDNDFVGPREVQQRADLFVEHVAVEGVGAQ